MGMEKKNPYVTTIGFNRKDPSYVQVAKILNEMGRGKAQYIVNAVMAYQNDEKQHVIGEIKYEDIRKIVKELLTENNDSAMCMKDDDNKILIEKKEEKCLKEKDINNILYSVSLFKK